MKSAIPSLQYLISFCATHNPGHSEPHAKPSSEFLADEESQDTSGEGSQVVDADDDALEGAAWVSERVAPVFVAYYAREDALVVAE